MDVPEILILEERIPAAELRRLVERSSTWWTSRRELTHALIGEGETL